MAWWRTNAAGDSFVGHRDRSIRETDAPIWGDGPADRMGVLVDEFVDATGRMPTEEEILAGFRFAARGRGRP